MKTIIRITALAACLYSVACTTITTRVTDPVTGAVTETTTQTVDPAAFTAGANAITVIAAPRVRAEK